MAVLQDQVAAGLGIMQWRGGELLAPAVVVVEARPRAFVGRVSDLYPDEATMIEGAVDKRVGEFTAGRVLARRAVRGLGGRLGSLLADEEGAPRWPAGVCGSISHTQGLCVVAAARRSQFRAVGIDVEQARGVERELWPYVCDDDERRWLLRQAPEEQAWLAGLFFSAKESAYKAQYFLSRAPLSFEDLHLEIDRSGRRFRVVFRTDRAAPFRRGDELKGRWLRRGALLFTAVTIC